MRYQVSPEEPESSSDGTIIEAYDPEMAAEFYVSRNHEGFDYAESCEVWVRKEDHLKAEPYFVTAVPEPIFRARRVSLPATTEGEG